jgi:hypothetical protein
MVRPLPLSLGMVKILVGVSTLVMTTALVRAEPAPSPEGFLAGGAVAGMLSANGVTDGATGRAMIEGGYVVAPHALWLHGEINHGWASSLYGGDSGVIAQARLGVETRTCDTRRIVCIYAGVDGGVQQFKWTGYDSDQSQPTTIESVRPIVAPRLGLDFGATRGFRVRPGIEADFAFEGPRSAGPTLALGGQW